MSRLAFRISSASAGIRALLGVLVVLSAGAVFSSLQAQSRVIYLGPTPITDAKTKPITVNDVIKLTKAGLSDDLIIEQIEKTGKPLNLSADDLVRLKDAHVSDRVMAVMIDPSKAANTSSRAAGNATMAAVRPGSNGWHPSDPPNFPAKIAVYAKQDGEWAELQPELVKWKTGGVMKSRLSVGLVKEDVNGQVDNPSSPTKVRAETEFLIVVPDGQVVSQYQLLRMHPRSDTREFCAVAGGTVIGTDDDSPDTRNFDAKQVAPDTYLIRLPVGTAAGEYGFLAPGDGSPENLGATRHIYSFTIAE